MPEIDGVNKVRHLFRTASQHQGGMVSSGKMWACAFAIGPYLAAKTLLFCGAKPNEWPITPHIGTIVVFIRRAGTAELISAIFYSYAAAASIMTIAMYSYLCRTGIKSSLKTYGLMAFSAIYGAVLMYTLWTGPSEDGFNGPPIRANLGLQAAAMNEYTYSALCSVLTIQIAAALAFPAAGLGLKLTKRK